MIKGIDTSYANGKFQWQKYNGNFAMIKATQGRSDYGSYSNRCIVDSQFLRSAKACKLYNIPFGVYHYLTATTIQEAEEEALYFIDTISYFRNDIKLWYAVDVESAQLPTDKLLLTNIVSKFCSVIKESGLKPMVYTSASWIKYERFIMPDNVPLWLALWTTNESAAKKYNPTIWQYGMDTTYGADGNIGYFNFNIDRGSEDLGSYEVGDTYTIQENDVYSNGIKVPKRLYGKKYNIGIVKEDKIFLPKILSWIKL